MQHVQWSQQRCSDLFKQISFELLSKSSEQADDHPRQICCCQSKRDLFEIALSWRKISKNLTSCWFDKMFVWQDCSKLFTSCSKLVLLQNCSKLVDNKLVDNKLVLTSWLAELYLLLYSKMFEELGKGLLKQTTSYLLEQVVEKLKSSELLCKQIRSSKLCSVSGLTNLQLFVKE